MPKYILCVQHVIYTVYLTTSDIAVTKYVRRLEQIVQKIYAFSYRPMSIFWIKFCNIQSKTILFELGFLLLLSDSATGLSAIFFYQCGSSEAGLVYGVYILMLRTNNIFYCSSDHANNKLGLKKWVYHVHFFLISSLARIETFLLMGLWKTVAFFRTKECIPFYRSNICRQRGRERVNQLCGYQILNAAAHRKNILSVVDAVQLKNVAL